MKWLLESNRWKHLVIGFIIAFSLNFETAVVSMISVEWKDKSWGGKFDWLDIAAGTIGAVIGSLLRCIILRDFNLIFNLY